MEYPTDILDYYYQTEYKDSDERETYLRFKRDYIDPLTIQKCIIFTRTNVNEDRVLSLSKGYGEQEDCIGTGCYDTTRLSITIYVLLYIYCGIIYKIFYKYEEKYYLIPYYISKLSFCLKIICDSIYRVTDRGYDINSLNMQTEESILQMYELNKTIPLYLQIYESDNSYIYHHFYFFQNLLCSSWGNDRIYFVLYNEEYLSEDEFIYLCNIFLKESLTEMDKELIIKYFFNESKFHFDVFERSQITKKCIDLMVQIKSESENPDDIPENIDELLDEKFKDSTEEEKINCKDYIETNFDELNILELNSWIKINKLENERVRMKKSQFKKQKLDYIKAYLTPNKNKIAISIFYSENYPRWIDADAMEHTELINNYIIEQIPIFTEYYKRGRSISNPFTLHAALFAHIYPLIKRIEIEVSYSKQFIMPILDIHNHGIKIIAEPIQESFDAYVSYIESKECLGLDKNEVPYCVSQKPEPSITMTKRKIEEIEPNVMTLRSGTEVRKKIGGKKTKRKFKKSKYSSKKYLLIRKKRTTKRKNKTKTRRGGSLIL